MKIAIAALLLLASCTPTILFIPQQYASCAGTVATPPTPKEPRTLAAIAQWANDLHDALHKANAARDDCADKLSGLNSWIVQKGH